MTIQPMSNYEVQSIQMSEIFSDDHFNCRGVISVVDVQELAADIKLNGLQFPICVQPAEDVKTFVPPGKKWRIIAGHRRHRAFMILGGKEIPAMIKRGLTELQALVHNLNENLKREELNIVQEAGALKRMKDLGLGQEAAAIAVGKTRSWVQIRYTLLELPEVIQAEAAAGILNQQQIKQIYSLPNDEARYAAVRKIKNALANGEKGIAVGKKATDDPFKKKRRQKSEVEEMMAHIAKESPVGFGLTTVAMAWCNGTVSSADVYLAIADEARKLDKPYRIPVDSLNDVNRPVPVTNHSVSEFSDDLPVTAGEANA